MGRDDQHAIEALFERLADAERNSGPRDREAEAFIRTAIERQPNAPYFMAQTIVVQQQALDEAHRRLGEDGEGSRGKRRPLEDERRAGPWGGGFLAGAAQTAMGVAGGVLLGNLIGGALFGHPASAQESDGNNRDDDKSDSNQNDTEVADADDDGGDFDGGSFDA